MSVIQSSVPVPSSDMSLIASNTAGGGVQSAEVSVATPAVAQFIAMLQDATPEQAADILSALDRGLPIFNSRKEVAVEKPLATPVKAKKAAAKAPGAPKKAEKAAKPVAELPSAAGGAPDASEYRITDIDESVCVGREFAGEDKRWKPIIFREAQCGGKVVEGSDLCTKCARRQEKYAAEPKAGPWKGRVTEEPLDWIHMLGTAWAEEKAPKFNGDTQSAAASDAGSVAEAEENASVEEMPAGDTQSAAPAPKAKTSAAAEKAAAAAAKKAEKEAAAAAKLAEKEAEKAKKLAEKEAAAAAKLAEKEAAAAAKKAEKEAEKAKKPAKKPAAKAKPAKKADAKVAAAEPVAVEGELKLIDGTLYMVKSGNVYDYDEMAEKAGDFVGRLCGDETIDPDAEEQGAAESDTD